MNHHSMLCKCGEYYLLDVCCGEYVRRVSTGELINEVNVDIGNHAPTGCNDEYINF